MTKNSEKYKKAASMIRSRLTDTEILEYVEEKSMTKNRTPFRKLAAVCASLLVAMTLGITAYAADFGGIRHNIKTWLHGDLSEMSIEEVGEGQFEITYADGTVRSCGGYAYDNGTERGITMDEMIESLLTDVEVDTDEEGITWLYIRDHKIDITDQLNENGYAQVKVKDGILADYITIVACGEDGFGIMSDHSSFPDPEEVRTNTAVF